MHWPRRVGARRACAPATGGLKAPGFVLLALAGAWLVHTLEYLRVWGTDGLASRLSAPLHLWMIPVGAVLLVIAAAGGVRWVRLHRLLGEQVEQARLALARRLRNQPAAARAPRHHRAVPAGTRAARAVLPARVSLTARLATLWVSLMVTIGAIYLVQENIEAAAASLPRPGLAPMTGIHAAAPLVIAAAAFLLAACAVEGRRRVAATANDVDAVERLLRALEGLGCAAAEPGASRVAAPPALALLGAQLWRRPPPRFAPAL